jgi:tRNA threonylcarbamoyladenosine biosynthesis protein TsaB
MKILAIDTSLAAGSVAAIDPTTSPWREAARGLGQPGEHAQRLAPALRDVAADLGWKPGDATVIAVVRGPGSFTGLRVGVTAAKAACWTTGARLVGVSGFELVAGLTAATAAAGRGPIAIAFDAGRGEVFAATAHGDADAVGGWRISPAALQPAAAWLDSLPADALVSGPALETLAEAAEARRLAVAPREAWFPSAGAAASLALARAAAGSFDDPHTLVPEYSRPSYADEKAARSTG